ncbi:hypothetical protein [Liquorilactobacillus capillatus]|uniref:Uncharacterized protein n=1 Tax=Liquorilactobacillus capillatus DSM 19910 TaxID=1423731 RepID=A0A0R1M368_9LACO|nr:hypothetical protein [Liquorilactobacillus capillatus]KRL00164.1 hypothetical protein FC81_GL000544 [Liquorilactobacillus capillatus DSM 19910]
MDKLALKLGINSVDYTITKVSLAGQFKGEFIELTVSEHLSKSDIYSFSKLIVDNKVYLFYGTSKPKNMDGTVLKFKLVTQHE